MTAAGLEVVLVETRHVKAALSAMTVKTDRKDARGIAHLIRMGWYRPVHCKSVSAQEVRALLAGRKLLQDKLLDIEASLRGLLRGFGLKVGKVGKGHFATRIRELVGGQRMLEEIAEPMLRARDTLRIEFARLHRQMLALAKADDVCRRFMTVSGVGALVALTFRTAIDDPRPVPTVERCRRPLRAHSQALPVRRDRCEGRISRIGDQGVRVALYEAANVILTRAVRGSDLKSWALGVAKRAGMKKAKVALARKLAVVLHRMLADGTTFMASPAAQATAVAG